VSSEALRIGGHIQRLRREKGISQARLAAELGISPSYLNLVEHNRRRITVELLLKLSRYFGVQAGELAETDRSRLAGDLLELFGDDMFADFKLTNQDIQDLAVSNSNVGHAVIRLYDRYLAQRKNDRANQAADEDMSEDVAADAVSDLLQINNNYFPMLEEAADRIRHDIDLSSDTFERGLRTYLYNVFGIHWRQEALPGDAPETIQLDAGDLVTSDLLPSESAIFLAARQLGYQAVAIEIDRILADVALPVDAEPVARRALCAYFAASLIMPYEAFHQACTQTRYDIERICHRFKTSFEQVCHRMTTLQRPGLLGVPMHLVRTDIAGNISKRFSLSGIRISRHSGACPRWNVYSAFLHPEQINVQVSQMPEGARYLCIAKTITKGGYRHNAPRRYLSVGLGCHISHAKELVYSDGLDLSNRDQSVPIGVSCRICPRTDCGQRAYARAPTGDAT